MSATPTTKQSSTEISTQPEFRRYPKNTWRLIRLRERHLALRFSEDQLTEEQQLYVQHSNKALRMKNSSDQLRSQHIENLSSLSLLSQKEHSNFLNHIKRIDNDEDSISSVPSLTSQSTVSPMSPNLFNEFHFQSPSLRLDEQPAQPRKFKR